MRAETVIKRFDAGIEAGRGVAIKDLRYGQRVYTPGNIAVFQGHVRGHGYRFMFESHWKDIGDNGRYTAWYAEHQADVKLVPVRRARRRAA